MANAQVEKLKTLGLRHGEKALVALTAALCALFLFVAVTKETIQTTPDEVSKRAEAARTNLQRRQEPADILATLQQQGIVDPGYVALVESQEKNGLKSSAFKVARLWVTPEPGAGLIRDRPRLVVPTELAAYPGRGGALLYELADGKRIPEDPSEKKTDPVVQQRRRKKRRHRGGGRAMAAAGQPGAVKELTEAEKREIARRKERIAASVAGKVEEEEKKDEAPAEEGGPFKESTRGLRWVAITGVIDNKKLTENYVAALKDPAVAHPNYKQINVQRRTLRSDVVQGESLESDVAWLAWEDVDIDKNREITNNLPEEEEELTPDDVRIAALVDPLPFLKAGYWERVHVASLVPKEKLEVEKPAPGGMTSAGTPYQQPPPPPPPPMPNMGMGMGMGMGGPGEQVNFARTDAPEIMIRALDFTVEPDTTYQFRVQLVVFNPNYNREDVSPGTDVKSLELKSDWSKPTNPVTMPPDVAAYAMRKTRFGPGSKRTDFVSFEIVKWNPEDGVTVTRDLDYGIGQIVGEVRSAPVPTSEGTGAKSRPIDFNSHSLLLDETGGEEPLTSVGIGGRLDIPTVSLLLRPDGSLVVRNEAFDIHDPVRVDISDNYDREVEDSNKKRETSNGHKKKRRRR